MTNHFAIAELGALDLEYERGALGSPLLLDCLRAVECRVETGWMSGDHWTVIARVHESRPRTSRVGQAPRRFGGPARRGRRVARSLFARTRLDALSSAVRGTSSPAISVASGTRGIVEVRETWMRGRPRQVAPSTPGICLVGCRQGLAEQPEQVEIRSGGSGERVRHAAYSIAGPARPSIAGSMRPRRPGRAFDRGSAGRSRRRDCTQKRQQTGCLDGQPVCTLSQPISAATLAASAWSRSA